MDNINRFMARGTDARMGSAARGMQGWGVYLGGEDARI